MYASSELHLWCICIHNRCIHKVFRLCEQACVFLGKQFSWRNSHIDRNSMKSSFRVSLCAFSLSLNSCKNIHTGHKHTLGCHVFRWLLRNFLKCELQCLWTGQNWCHNDNMWRVPPQNWQIWHFSWFCCYCPPSVPESGWLIGRLELNWIELYGHRRKQMHSNG